MIYWFLIVCAGLGSQCLPLQPTASKQQCEFLSKTYQEMSVHVAARCVGLKQDLPNK